MITGGEDSDASYLSDEPIFEDCEEVDENDPAWVPLEGVTGAVTADDGSPPVQHAVNAAQAVATGHLGIGSGSEDSDAEKAQFDALVPYAEEEPEDEERQVAPAANATAVSEEWSRQSGAFVQGSAINPICGSPANMALIAIRSGMSIEGVKQFLEAMEEQLRAAGKPVTLSCANLQHYQRKLRSDVWRHGGVRRYSVAMRRTVPRPLTLPDMQFKYVYTCYLQKWLSRFRADTSFSPL